MAEADPIAEEETTSLAIHVALCRERYKAVSARMKRIEFAIYVLVGVAVMNSEAPALKALFGALKP